VSVTGFATKAKPILCFCVINWLTDTGPAASVEKSEEPQFAASVSAPVSTSPSQMAEREHSTEKSSEPVQVTTAVTEVPPESVEQPAFEVEVAVPAAVTEVTPESVDRPAVGFDAQVPPAVTEMPPESVEHPAFEVEVAHPAAATEVSPESVERPAVGFDVQVPAAETEVPPESVDHAPVGFEVPVPTAEVSVAPGTGFPEDSLVSDDPNVHGVRIYTDTTEGVPQVERDVQETEEVLPDGTVVRRQVVRTSQRQTISTRVVMEGPEDILPTSKAEAEQMLGEIGVSEELGRQIVTSDSEPQASTNVEEHEEVLPDGSIVKRRVVTTTKQHVTTERVSLEDDDIPAGTVRGR